MSESLHIGLITRQKPYLRNRDDRVIGLFSYAVPEFTWEHIQPGKRATLNRNEYRHCDALVLEDGAWVNFTGDGPPVAGVFWDTTWTDAHYQERHTQAGQCDLVLIDHDDLARWAGVGAPVRRFLYCVNDRLFRDYGQPRAVDVGYHCKNRYSQERQRYTAWLETFCAAHGYSTRIATIHDTGAYARAFNAERLNVNVAQSPRNRPHRVYDCLASRGCLLTTPLPNGFDDGLRDGVHYRAFRSTAELGAIITGLLDSGEWAALADAGHAHIMRCHTWALRARELRRLLHEELGL